MERVPETTRPVMTVKRAVEENTTHRATLCSWYVRQIRSRPLTALANAQSRNAQKQDSASVRRALWILGMANGYAVRRGTRLH